MFNYLLTQTEIQKNDSNVFLINSEHVFAISVLVTNLPVLVLGSSILVIIIFPKAYPAFTCMLKLIIKALYQIRDCRQILPLIIRQFKQIN